MILKVTLRFRRRFSSVSSGRNGCVAPTPRVRKFAACTPPRIKIERIASAVGAPRYTVHEIVGQLRQAGLLETFDGVGKVLLGRRLHYLGIAYVKNFDLGARPTNAETIDVADQSDVRALHDR